MGAPAGSREVSILTWPLETGCFRSSSRNPPLAMVAGASGKEGGASAGVREVLDSPLASGARFFQVLVANPADRDGCRRFHGASLDRRPGIGIGRPCVRGSLLRGQLGKFVV